MNPVDFTSINLENGFWARRKKQIGDVTIYAVQKQFQDTGRFEAFQCKKGNQMVHPFWDSDIAKWIEAVAYLCAQGPYPHLERTVDGVIKQIEQHRLKTGYFNSYFLSVKPDEIWKNRSDHELYCAGHLIEAAVAYARCTGKKKFLHLMEDFAAEIERVFVAEKSAGFITPGHEEIELALMKLYQYTKNTRYLNLARFFLEQRGRQQEESYFWSKPCHNQSHLPVRKQTSAQGHAVRAVYLYSAMADLARIDEDTELKAACEAIFLDIVQKKMYLTGGIGSSSCGEAFTKPYDLPNLRAYAETCASIGMVYFAQRMLLLEPNRMYSDLVEREIYNGILSGISLDGTAFFYENPLEVEPYLVDRDVSIQENASDRTRFPATQRKKVFDCSCCPPNLCRFIASIGSLMFTEEDGTVYLHQYMNASATVGGGQITLKTDYPYSGKMVITTDQIKNLAIRIPGWCNRYTIEIDGMAVHPEEANGYILVSLAERAQVVLDLEMKPVVLEAAPSVIADSGKAAIMCGPIVYCAEGVDNGENLHDIAIDPQNPFQKGYDSSLHTVVLKTTGYIRDWDAGHADLYRPVKAEKKEVPLTLIPYFAFANRGETAMTVWLKRLYK